MKPIDLPFSFHRDSAIKEFLGTQLTNIPGIGKVIAEKLLKNLVLSNG
ncbi:MAG: hypothetical protein IPO48_09275 [Saprospiraceae bacterium]|nr:hypothetical protein [Saprospiraceae bacterium]